MTPVDYWKECVSVAAEECDADLSSDQITYIANAVQVAHENYGMAFYSPPAGEHIMRENKQLARELARERAKVFCDGCKGTGRLRYNAGPWAVDTQCSKCHGHGKIDP
jgi:hypothetical protein